LTKSRAVTELLIAGLFWGFGFVGIVWSLKGLGPAAIVFYRFTIAFTVGILVLVAQRKPLSLLKGELKLALIPGIFLWLTLFLQTCGLKFTTATNSTFITTLYVVIVPLLNSITGKEKLNWLHWLCVAIALGGTALIVQIQNLSSLNWGDLLTLLCSIFAAIHILAIDQRIAHTKDDFAFNTFQSFWMAAFSLVLFPFSDRWNLSALPSEGWIGICALGFGASLISFYLQIRAQKVISPSVVSLLFLLESPISCVFAFWLLGEKMNFMQWMGALLILISCGLISFLQTREPVGAPPN
jgi:drug/metabolite transporter (DMT)-like permease